VPGNRADADKAGAKREACPCETAKGRIDPANLPSERHRSGQATRPATIVVDSSLLASLSLPGEHTQAAEALRERDPDRATPVLWRSEFRNILAGYMRRKDISSDEGLGLQLEAESLLAACEFEAESRNVLELVCQSD
jgi:hypothetical protein